MMVCLSLVSDSKKHPRHERGCLLYHQHASPSTGSGEIPEIDHDFQHAAGVPVKILKGLSGLAERIDVGYDAVKLQVPAPDGIDQFDEIPVQLSIWILSRFQITAVFIGAFLQ